MPNYSHPEWRKKRESILSDRNYECEKCSRKQNLQVHHKKYISGRREWQYANNELQVLCANCHREQHGLVGKMKTCSYPGCDWEIEPQYEYCFKHKQVVADEKMDEASMKMQRAEEMKKEVERLKAELNSGGKDFDRYEKLEKQMMQIQGMIQKQSQQIKSGQNQSTRQKIVEQKKTKSGSGIIAVLAIVIAAIIIAFANSGGNQATPSPSSPSSSGNLPETKTPGGTTGKKVYYCFDCKDNGIVSRMVQRTNSKTGKKFYGCSRFPRCRNTF